ncbi:serine-rich adhesin for platelets-like isoform X1 [Anastrepha ludens]|uniref:serine-rich adhesin for platelets-like isoform X1 n=1 Tax=Anastrepha ludens TaxID=28586 RepID=UPI0023B0E004|nr:serine-rich adhesin for platelets-like isoform X1 [Anastrepha ludens]XP_053957411.1 serine-rich adhesin for platelets-like isoform X1 [Anastrepha ludens]XP_053957413.1 serine-rich adhesin for platelets-like isoform X1 [Anastrepha ludens]
MEHLDLAGVINTPVMWNMSAFDQQDAIYLSNSRQMLEPILEETSEDEEHAQNSWNQYEQSREHFWSSAESETGSVIRVEISKDPDSISERDFVCPAKRARRCDDFIIGGQLSSAAQSTAQQPSQVQAASGTYDDTVLLRRTQRPIDTNEANSNSLERFLAYEACTRDSWGQQSLQVLPQRNSTGSRRFDEYSDSDSISYHSLSRSSSLIQFESLERQLQLQEQHASMSSLGNSSPSLLSFDDARSTGALNGEDGVRSGANSGSNSGNNSRRGSQSSLLKRFESSDGRLHQTYFDLDKLSFDDDQRVIFGANKANLMEATVGEVKSDSESSTSSDSSSGNSILTASKPSAEDLTDSSSTAFTRAGRIIAFQRAGKSSAENLSEDSGYCEPSTLRRTKSKSIPNNFEKFCEEEEEFQQYDYASERHAVGDVDSVTKTTHQQQQHSKNIINNHNHINSNNNNIRGDAASTKHYVVEHDICQPKINDATFVVATDDETALNAPTTPPPLPTSSLPPAINREGGEHAEMDDSEGDVGHVEECDEEHDVDTEAFGSRHVSACPRYERVKNSPTREAATACLLLEQRRSLAHSPSPVASDVSSSSASSASSGSSCGTTRSSTSASTCASAASFTWLPTPKQLQLQQHQLQLQLERTQRQTSASAKLELLAAQQRSTLENFCASLRNSLPDIRDALGTITCNTVIETNFPILSEKHNGSDVSDANGHGLEHLRSETKTPERERIDTERSDGSTRRPTHNLDDSDFSTTSPSASASARESHSDETDNESTPEAKKRQRVYNNGSGGGSGVPESSSVGGFSGYVSSGRRISSVPSELNKLGRKKRVSTRYRHSKSSPEENAATETSPSNSSADEAEDEDFFDPAASFKIRRSCSWSERRERNLQRFEAAFGSRAQREGSRSWVTQSLGYMNASYQDLTQLDYSGKQLEGGSRQQSNLKRCSDYVASDCDRDTGSDDMDTPKSTATADYENIICKGNFLLDELSQIYDRNASILNDKPIGAEEQLLLPKTDDIVDRPSCSPRAPPRQRKHSNSSYSDLDSVGGSVGCADEQVVGPTAQHVQLMIRKPPARQKHARKSEATHSLISDAQLFASETTTTNTSTMAHSKTFDQDPTNLHTSYTQSLEKCNFDPKELSNTELNKSNSIPKRRFHSQTNTTKQRNMVSSTPNLNAYDPHADEVEDDMYVSSAHTSMHQLPQATAQKPLGILLPAGSRTSFSKEVSFCPVVSQYSWQEQSSEEYAEQHQHQQQQSENAPSDGQQEDTDDELLDNADATVIQNTRVNEMIAARYAVELKNALTVGNASKSVAQIRAVPIEKVRALIIVKERQAAEERERERARLQEREQLEESAQHTESAGKTLHKVIDYSAETKGEALKLDSNAPADVAAATATAVGYNETVDAETVNVSHKSTIIDATTNFIKAEQTTVVEEEANNEINNDAQTNRNSSFSGASWSGASFNDNASDSNSAASGKAQTRPLSIHLPILSEPPTNRAHHILYASQQLLDNFERRESEQYYNQNNVNKCESALGGSEGVADRRTKSVGNLSVAQTTRYRMSNATVGMGGQSGSGSGTAAANNNNDLLNKKFKDEKHPSSKGFLSRFAHGLRFSLRRKNKKQLQQQQQQQQQQHEQQVSDQNGMTAAADKSTMRKSFGKSATLPQLKQQQQQQRQASVQQLSTTPNKAKRTSAQSGADYIYIPLKGPIPPAGTQPPPPSATVSANGGNSATLPANFSPADAQIGAKGQQTATPNNNNSATNTNTNSSAINSNRSGSDKSDMRAITDKNGEPLVTGKPPKPYRYGTIPSTTSSTTIITKYFGSGRRQGGGGVPAHAHKDGNGKANATNFKSRSQFYTDFLDAERSYYDDEEIEKQLDAGLQANDNAVTTTPNDAPANANDSNVSEITLQQQQQQTLNQENLRETDNSSESASVIVEYETPSRAQQSAQVAYSLPGVTRETVMLLTTGTTGSGVTVGANGSDSNARVVAPTYTTMSNAYLQHTNNNNKIGLIETNLDTHETVISGKTRSLVDIVGPQQHQQQYGVVGGGIGAGGVAKRLNMSAACGGNVDLDDDLDEDVRVYGHDVGGRGGAVVIKSTTANGSQIASVRRPHKSMEFLLDKENQKNVLVRITKFYTSPGQIISE